MTHGAPKGQIGGAWVGWDHHLGGLKPGGGSRKHGDIVKSGPRGAPPAIYNVKEISKAIYMTISTIF